jgi:hypothetical protein
LTLATLSSIHVNQRLLCAGLLAALCIAPVAQAGSRPRSSSWMFRRSYYTHSPARDVQIGAESTGGPRYTRPRGAYYSGGYRWLRSNIVVGGQVFDSFNVIESWGETGDKY